MVEERPICAERPICSGNTHMRLLARSAIADRKGGEMTAATTTSRLHAAPAANVADPRIDLLFRRFRREGDRAARETLITHFLPLARKLAWRYAHSSEPFEDLVQVAGLALVKAIDRFDPDRGTGFATFAVPTILGELRRYFRDCAWSVHVPRAAQERAA